MTGRIGDSPDDLLAGRLILLVEDDALVALDLLHALEAHGACVVGPVATVYEALELIEITPGLDGAVLDVELRGELSFPIAARLRDCGIPFVFETGYDERTIPEPYASAPRLAKPADLQLMALALIGQDGDPSG